MRKHAEKALFSVCEVAGGNGDRGRVFGTRYGNMQRKRCLASVKSQEVTEIAVESWYPLFNVDLSPRRYCGGLKIHTARERETALF